MTKPVSHSTTPLLPMQPHPEVCFRETMYYYCETKLLCFTKKVSFTSVPLKAVISTGDAYSVILPFSHTDELKIVSEKIPVSPNPTWCGVPCAVLKVWLGLSILESDSPRPFLLNALLPLAPETLPQDIPPVLRMGEEFLLSHQAELQISFTNNQGKLIIPY